MQHVQRAGQVDGDELFPLGGHGFEEGLEHIPAGVIDQHGDGAELGLSGGHSRIDLGAVGDVAGEGSSLATARADVRGHFFSGFEVHVEHGHLGAFAGKTAARSPANATAATGHDYCLAIKSLHGFLLGCQG